MTDRGLGQLSERQRECLRLLYANLGVKEIAAELSLSPFTVRTHLRDARRIVGASRSMQAARLLVEHERDTSGIATPNRIGLDRHFPHDVSATSVSEPAAVVRNRYHFGLLQRIGLIVAIAFVAVALAGALLVGAEAITRIFVDYRIDISDPPYRQ